MGARAPPLILRFPTLTLLPKLNLLPSLSFALWWQRGSVCVCVCVCRSPPNVSHGSDKEFGRVHLNVMSLSPQPDTQTKTYKQHNHTNKYWLPREVQALSSNEVHKTGIISIKSKFRGNSYKIYFNPTEKSKRSVIGTHGGGRR